jgi:hypothetical protein
LMNRRHGLPGLPPQSSLWRDEVRMRSGLGEVMITHLPAVSRGTAVSPSRSRTCNHQQYLKTSPGRPQATAGCVWTLHQQDVILC